MLSFDVGCTFGSCVGVESPKETLSRIAYGVFGAVNATTSVGTSVGGPLNENTSGGCNYSPPQHGDFLFGMDA
jgi:hypothetical protein